ncbi:uncharacterized protein VTP21DRAFT_5360 [Calcarisporiella thermophila]|uniref:uncharacterized protein n=1 Tax=Calcarisporiella thermophila TaxID=911321 RepID=UPI003742401C
MGDGQQRVRQGQSSGKAAAHKRATRQAFAGGWAPAQLRPDGRVATAPAWAFCGAGGRRCRGEQGANPAQISLQAPASNENRQVFCIASREDGPKDQRVRLVTGSAMGAQRHKLRRDDI